MIPKERRLCTYDFQGDECPWNYKCDDDEDCDFLMFNVEVGDQFEGNGEVITVKAIVDTFQVVLLFQIQLCGDVYELWHLNEIKKLGKLKFKKREGMKTNYEYLTDEMDLSGLLTMSWDEMVKMGIVTKQDLAKKCIPKDITFDYALPLYFVDGMRGFFGDRFDYRKFVFTSFALYSDGRNINCLIWSACREQNNMIIKFINRKE